ncbi:MAG: M23 family metallopeptidase, partial [Syntrophales bacterium]|nr:M23 family metallopeptidase [Syntrophales bacterium]
TNRVQTESLGLLAEKVSYFERKISELNEFDRKIRIISNLEVPEDEDGLFGVGGSVPEEDSAAERLSETQLKLIDEIHQEIDQLLEESSAQERSFRELVDYLKTQKSILARTPSIWPVVGWVTSEFGNRKSPFTDKREFHNGIDIATRPGKEIVAPADGVVTVVSKDRYMGNLVWIDHGDDVKTCYGHLREQAVKAGQQVKRGDVIGYVGSSGRSTGPHLHYGVMVKGEYVNPRRYLF